jgi:PAS domain S-box-containing protein
MLSRELLQSVLDWVPDAMVVVAESGTILFVNQQASRLFGYTAGELHGESVELLVPEWLRLPHIGHRLRFTDERRTRPMGAGPRLLARCNDGSERSVGISLTPVQHGLETVLVAVIRDLTDRAD